MLTSRKITTYADNIKDISDTPSADGITAPILKAKFDGRTDAEIKNSINGIVDDLTSTADGVSGADQIGATPLKVGGASTPQGIMEELKADKVEINEPITGATKCKVTYDTKGLVTGGADLTKTDLPAEAVLTENIISAVTTAMRENKIPNEKAIYDIMEAVGAGDMTKAVYDTDNNGIVDNAEKVNGLTVETAVPTGAIFTDTVTTVENVLTSTSTTHALSAAQGKALNDAKAPIASPTFTGVATAPTNTSYTTRQMRNIVLSTSAASGGSNGDVWLKYEA